MAELSKTERVRPYMFYDTAARSATMLVSWGVAQWIVLLPLILSRSRNGHRRTVAGMIIPGGLGLLLSSACASMLFSYLVRPLPR